MSGLGSTSHPPMLPIYIQQYGRLRLIHRPPICAVVGRLSELATNQSTERASVWLLCEFYVEASMDADLSPGQYAGEILLADISGFTVFLEDVKLAHASDAFADGQIPYAYELLSGLLGADGLLLLVHVPTESDPDYGRPQTRERITAHMGGR
jgi:hypothetical protein